jgi:hypothetical protein
MQTDIFTNVAPLNITQRIELITPERATQLLSKNKNNRPIIKANLKRLVLVLKKGQFKFNGDSIKITKEGMIIDGQHRLMAIEESKISAYINVIEGLDAEVFDTLDQGTPRSTSSMLHIIGHKNTNVSAAVIPLLQKYLQYHAPVRGGNATPIKADALNFHKEWEVIIAEAASYSAGNTDLKKLLSPSYLAFLYVIFSMVNKQQCIQFLDDVTQGNNLSKNSPALMIRNRLVKSALSNKKEDAYTKSALTIMAWNAYRQGKELKMLRWTKDGDGAQDYPRAE